VLKRCFRILLLPIEYSIEVQARLPAGLAAIHNFTRIHDLSCDEDNIDDSTDNTGDGDEELPAAAASTANASAVEERNAASVMRDTIAQKMWEDYVVALSNRHDEDSGESDEYHYESDV
jgi:hypothetical protein